MVTNKLFFSTSFLSVTHSYSIIYMHFPFSTLSPAHSFITLIQCLEHSADFYVRKKLFFFYCLLSAFLWWWEISLSYKSSSFKQLSKYSEHLYTTMFSFFQSHCCFHITTSKLLYCALQSQTSQMSKWKHWRGTWTQGETWVKFTPCQVPRLWLQKILQKGEKKNLWETLTCINVCFLTC